MIGRAGRPGLENEGSVVVMTERGKVNKMERYLDDDYQGEEIKSHFRSLFPEALNNEIAMKTVKHKEEIVLYLKNTLVYQ